MELTCRQCRAHFRAAVQLPVPAPVRLVCPSCRAEMVLRPKPAGAPRRVAAIADDPRPFRRFLGEHLRRLGFDVAYFETGDPLLEHVRQTRADLVIVNVY